jgi:hypothetical protein
MLAPLFLGGVSACKADGAVYFTDNITKILLQNKFQNFNNQIPKIKLLNTKSPKTKKRKFPSFF